MSLRYDKELGLDQQITRRDFVYGSSLFVGSMLAGCGKVDPQAIEIIRAWPVGYVKWKLMEMKSRAGPKTAPWGAISVDQHLASQCGAYRGQRHENPIMPRRIASQARNVP